MFVYIYKLIKKNAINDDIVYIGSTEDIEARMSKHKLRCNNINNNRKYNLKVYKYIRDNGGWDEWKYEIIDEVEVALRNDAARYEGEYIIKYDAINKLNEVVAGRTRKEYCEQNKEHFIQKRKEKYQQNREYILQKNKENYQQNRDHILQRVKEYREKNKEHFKQKDKEKYERNKDHILQRVKEYKEKNKDAINERRRELRRLAKLNKL